VFLGLLCGVATGRPALDDVSVARLRALARAVHLEVLASPT
jgi:hypothetical protein